MRIFVLCLLLLELNIGLSQEQIFFANPSFEAQPKHSSTPIDWDDCGHINESPPDIHPANPPAFGVNQKPQDGDTYLGMVVRENDTQEAVGQQLMKPLIAEECYSFSIYLACSNQYYSISRKTKEDIQYDSPTMLRVWSGNTLWAKDKLLATSDLITHTDWRKYEFTIQPQQEVDYIILEAYYQTPTLFPYNGNLLLDNLSPINAVDCKVERNIHE